MVENLDVFASKGIIIHINSEHYAKLKKMTNVATSRQTIKKVTVHNDKLMVDWSVPKKAFVIDKSGVQFSTSSYKKFLAAA